MELHYPLRFNKSTKDKLCKSQYTVGKKKHINCNIGHLNLSSDVGRNFNLRAEEGSVYSGLIKYDGLIWNR